jgi:hypothetical protein
VTGRAAKQQPVQRTPWTSGCRPRDRGSHAAAVSREYAPEDEWGLDRRVATNLHFAILKTRRVAGSAVALIVADADLSFRESGCAQEVAPGRIRSAANFRKQGTSRYAVASQNCCK